MKMKLDIHNLYLLGLLIAIIVFLIVIYFEMKTIQNNIKEINKPLNSPQIPNNTLPSNEQNTQVLESVEFLDLDKLEDLDSHASDEKKNEPAPNTNNITENFQKIVNNNEYEDLDADDNDDEDEDIDEDEDNDDLDEDEDGSESMGEGSLSSQQIIDKLNNEDENDIDEMDEELSAEMEKKRILNMNSLKELKKIAAENRIVQKGTKDELIDRLVKSTEFNLEEYIKNRESQ